MVQSTDLLRTTSVDSPHVQPQSGNINSDNDCGCSWLPCLTKRLCLGKLAKPVVFVVVLSIVGFLYGSIFKYFHESALLWSNHFHISESTLEYINYTNEFVIALVALLIVFRGNNLNKPKCVGFLTIYLGISCLTLLVPEIYQPYKTSWNDNSNQEDGTLCLQSTTLDQEKRNTINLIKENFFSNEIVAVGIFTVHQFIYGLCIISFIVHGITYLDDIESKNGHLYIAILFAAQSLGKLVGMYSFRIPYDLGTEYIFRSSGWIIISVFTFLFGCSLVMFPRTMTTMKTYVLVPLNTENNEQKNSTIIQVFLASLSRILKNKIIMLNIMSIILMKAATINLADFEPYYNQSKFNKPISKNISEYNYLRKYQDIKQVLVAISCIVSGIMFAKIRFKTKHLVIWNVAAFLLIFVGFVGISFVNCTTTLDISSSYNHMQAEYCHRHCDCQNGSFKPVCINQKTYFSSCIAGCSSFNSTLDVYQNCVCANGMKNAYKEACDKDNCNILWNLTQIHSIIWWGLFASTFISSLLITMRHIASKDKVLVLGMQLICSGFVSSLPIRAIYKYIIDSSCYFNDTTPCLYYSKTLALGLVIITIILMTLAISLALVLVFIIKNTVYIRKKALHDITEADTLHTNNIQRINNATLSETESMVDRPRNPLTTKQQSDSALNMLPKRFSKNGRIKPYMNERNVSEGNLDSSPSSSRTGQGHFKTLNSYRSDVSTGSSLNALANAIGDNHDSDVSFLQTPQRQRRISHEHSLASQYSKSSSNLIETSF